MSGDNMIRNGNITYDIDDVDEDVLVPENIFEDYDQAYAFLMHFPYHVKGQFVEALYKKPVDDEGSEIGVLLAIGIKNWYDCGIEAEEDIDYDDIRDYQGQYNLDCCGPEFFEIVSCRCDGSGTGGKKYITTIKLNGSNFDVYNNVKRNEVIEDPFTWEPLAKDSGEFVDPVIPIDPNIPAEDTNNTDITFNDSQFVVASRDEQSVEDAFDWGKENIFDGFEVPDNQQDSGTVSTTSGDDIFGDFEIK